MVGIEGCDSIGSGMIVCGDGVEGSTCGLGSEVLGDDLPSIGEEQGDGDTDVSDLS